MIIPSALANSNVPNLSCTREELAVLVEARRHYSICGVKGLLDTVAMMHIDVNVQNPLVVSQ